MSVRAAKDGRAMSIQDQRWINSFLLVRGPRHDVRRRAPAGGRVSQAIHEYPVLGLSALAVWKGPRTYARQLPDHHVSTRGFSLIKVFVRGFQTRVWMKPRPAMKHTDTRRD